MSATTYDSRVDGPRNGPTTGPGSTTIDTTTAWSGGPHIHRRIAWGALIGGVILTIAIQLLLSLLGAGIGLGTVNTNAGSTPSASSLGMGAGIWWVVSSVIALFIGGYVTAWMAGVETRFDGFLHGVIAWGIATLLTVWLLSSAIGGIIGGGFSALGGIASSAGGGISQAAKPLAQAAGVSPDTLNQQAQAYLNPPTTSNPATMTPQDAQKEIGTNLLTYARGGADAPAAKERIVTIIAAQRKISHGDAEKQFDDAQAKMNQTKDQTVQTAKNAADTGAKGVSEGAFAGFGVLLLDLIAAAIGGLLGVQRRVRSTHRVVEGDAVRA